MKMIKRILNNILYKLNIIDGGEYRIRLLKILSE